MKLNDNKGFTLVEGLVSFILMSAILSTYLPAFYIELNRLTLLEQEVHQWRQFYEVYQTYAQLKEPVELGEIIEYEFKEGKATVLFEDGTVLSVEQQ